LTRFNVSPDVTRAAHSLVDIARSGHRCTACRCGRAQQTWRTVSACCLMLLNAFSPRRTNIRILPTARATMQDVGAGHVLDDHWTASVTAGLPNNVYTPARRSLLFTPRYHQAPFWRRSSEQLRRDIVYSANRHCAGCAGRHSATFIYRLPIMLTCSLRLRTCGLDATRTHEHRIALNLCLTLFTHHNASPQHGFISRHTSHAVVSKWTSPPPSPRPPPYHPF